jgi:hypothetical protein
MRLRLLGVRLAKLTAHDDLTPTRPLSDTAPAPLMAPTPSSPSRMHKAPPPIILLDSPPPPRALMAQSDEHCHPAVPADFDGHFTCYEDGEDDEKGEDGFGEPIDFEDDGDDELEHAQEFLDDVDDDAQEFLHVARPSASAMHDDLTAYANTPSTVQCPICGKDTEFALVNRHIDVCLNEKSACLREVAGSKSTGGVGEKDVCKIRQQPTLERFVKKVRK